MPKFSDNQTPSLLLAEQAGAPTTPATGFWRLYAKSDGLYLVDDAGVETGPFGSVGSIDALSDVDTSTVAPTDGQVLTWDNANSVWEPATPSGGGGSAANITGAYDIEGDGSPAYTDAGLSDEFSSGTLDAQWTAVNSTASGTVDIMGTVTNPIYDLASRSGTLLVQTGNSANTEMQLRADVSSISVGDSIVVSASIPSVPFKANNHYRVGITVAQNATDYEGGDYAQIYYDGTDISDMKFFYNVSGATSASSVVASVTFGRMYFRCNRAASNAFHFFFSQDGTVWVPLGSVTVATAAYFYLFAGSPLSWTRNGSGDPIAAFNWVRHVANQNLDPW